MKAIIDNIEITDANKAMVEFTGSIDYKELCDHAAAKAKVSCTFEQPKIRANHSGRLYLVLESSNVAEQTGAFAAILKICQITSFTSGVCTDKDTGEFKFWARLSLSYKHKDGGENGMELLAAQYTERDGWTFI